MTETTYPNAVGDPGILSAIDELLTERNFSKSLNPMFGTVRPISELASKYMQSAIVNASKIAEGVNGADLNYYLNIFDPNYKRMGQICKNQLMHDAVDEAISGMTKSASAKYLSAVKKMVETAQREDGDDYYIPQDRLFALAKAYESGMPIDQASKDMDGNAQQKPEEDQSSQETPKEEPPAEETPNYWAQAEETPDWATVDESTFRRGLFSGKLGNTSSDGFKDVYNGWMAEREKHFSDSASKHRAMMTKYMGVASGLVPGEEDFTKDQAMAKLEQAVENHDEAAIVPYAYVLTHNLDGLTPGERKDRFRIATDVLNNAIQPKDTPPVPGEPPSKETSQSEACARKILAKMYLDGTAVQDGESVGKKGAEYAFKLFSEGKDPDSMYYASRCLANGIGCQQDKVQAAALLDQARALGSEVALKYADPDPSKVFDFNDSGDVWNGPAGRMFRKKIRNAATSEERRKILKDYCKEQGIDTSKFRSLGPTYDPTGANAAYAAENFDRYIRAAAYAGDVDDTIWKNYRTYGPGYKADVGPDFWEFRDLKKYTDPNTTGFVSVGNRLENIKNSCGADSAEAAAAMLMLDTVYNSRTGGPHRMGSSYDVTKFINTLKKYMPTVRHQSSDDYLEGVPGLEGAKPYLNKLLAYSTRHDNPVVDNFLYNLFNINTTFAGRGWFTRRKNAMSASNSATGAMSINDIDYTSLTDPNDKAFVDTLYKGYDAYKQLAEEYDRDEASKKSNQTELKFISDAKQKCVDLVSEYATQPNSPELAAKLREVILNCIETAENKITTPKRGKQFIDFLEWIDCSKLGLHVKAKQITPEEQEKMDDEADWAKVYSMEDSFKSAQEVWDKTKRMNENDERVDNIPTLFENTLLCNPNLARQYRDKMLRALDGSIQGHSLIPWDSLNNDTLRIKTVGDDNAFSDKMIQTINAMLQNRNRLELNEKVSDEDWENVINEMLQGVFGANVDPVKVSRQGYDPRADAAEGVVVTPYTAADTLPVLVFSAQESEFLNKIGLARRCNAIAVKNLNCLIENIVGDDDWIKAKKEDEGEYPRLEKAIFGTVTSENFANTSLALKSAVLPMSLLEPLNDKDDYTDAAKKDLEVYTKIKEMKESGRDTFVLTKPVYKMIKERNQGLAHQLLVRRARNLYSSLSAKLTTQRIVGNVLSMSYKTGDRGLNETVVRFLKDGSMEDREPLVNYVSGLDALDKSSVAYNPDRITIPEPEKFFAGFPGGTKDEFIKYMVQKIDPTAQSVEDIPIPEPVKAEIFPSQTDSDRIHIKEGWEKYYTAGDLVYKVYDMIHQEEDRIKGYEKAIIQFQAEYAASHNDTVLELDPKWADPAKSKEFYTKNGLDMNDPDARSAWWKYKSLCESINRCKSNIDRWRRESTLITSTWADTVNACINNGSENNQFHAGVRKGYKALLNAMADTLSGAGSLDAECTDYFGVNAQHELSELNESDMMDLLTGIYSKGAIGDATRLSVTPQGWAKKAEFAEGELAALNDDSVFGGYIDDVKKWPSMMTNRVDTYEAGLSTDDFIDEGQNCMEYINKLMSWRVGDQPYAPRIMCKYDEMPPEAESVLKHEKIKVCFYDGKNIPGRPHFQRLVYYVDRYPGADESHPKILATEEFLQYEKKLYPLNMILYDPTEAGKVPVTHGSMEYLSNYTVSKPAYLLKTNFDSRKMDYTKPPIEKYYDCKFDLNAPARIKEEGYLNKLGDYWAYDAVDNSPCYTITWKDPSHEVGKGERECTLHLANGSDVPFEAALQYRKKTTLPAYIKGAKKRSAAEENAKEDVISNGDLIKELNRIGNIRSLFSTGDKMVTLLKKEIFDQENLLAEHSDPRRAVSKDHHGTAPAPQKAIDLEFNKRREREEHRLNVLKDLLRVYQKYGTSALDRFFEMQKELAEIWSNRQYTVNHKKTLTEALKQKYKL